MTITTAQQSTEQVKQKLAAFCRAGAAVTAGDKECSTFWHNMEQQVMQLNDSEIEVIANAQERPVIDLGEMFKIFVLSKKFDEHIDAHESLVALIDAGHTQKAIELLGAWDNKKMTTEEVRDVATATLTTQEELKSLLAKPQQTFKAIVALTPHVSYQDAKDLLNVLLVEAIERIKNRSITFKMHFTDLFLEWRDEALALYKTN